MEKITGPLSLNKVSTAYKGIFSYEQNINILPRTNLNPSLLLFCILIRFWEWNENYIMYNHFVWKSLVMGLITIPTELYYCENRSITYYFSIAYYLLPHVWQEVSKIGHIVCEIMCLWESKRWNDAFQFVYLTESSIHN